MVVKIKSSSTPQEIEKALHKLNSNGRSEKKIRKSFDAYKYCGVLKLKENPLAIQKRLRNEWQ